MQLTEAGVKDIFKDISTNRMGILIHQTLFITKNIKAIIG